MSNFGREDQVGREHIWNQFGHFWFHSEIDLFIYLFMYICIYLFENVKILFHVSILSMAFENWLESVFWRYLDSCFTVGIFFLRYLIFTVLSVCLPSPQVLHQKSFFIKLYKETSIFFLADYNQDYLNLGLRNLTVYYSVKIPWHGISS